jgi:hypothetical protein
MIPEQTAPFVLKENGPMLYRIMRPAKSRPGPLACEAYNRIKDAGYRRKQERAFRARLKPTQPIDIPLKSTPVRRQSAAWPDTAVNASNTATAAAARAKAPAWPSPPVRGTARWSWLPDTRRALQKPWPQGCGIGDKWPLP